MMWLCDYSRAYFPNQKKSSYTLLSSYPREVGLRVARHYSSWAVSTWADTCRGVKNKSIDLLRDIYKEHASQQAFERLNTRFTPWLSHPSSLWTIWLIFRPYFRGDNPIVMEQNHVYIYEDCRAMVQLFQPPKPRKKTYGICLNLTGIPCSPRILRGNAYHQPERILPTRTHTTKGCEMYLAHG